MSGFIKDTGFQIIVSLCLLLQYTNGTCDFPSVFQNKVFHSSYNLFNGISFGTSTVNFTDSTTGSGPVSEWACHQVSGEKIAIRSAQTYPVLSIDAYYYYCLQYTKQTDSSVLFYILSYEATNGSPRMARSASFTDITVDVLTTVPVTSDTLPTYDVMIDNANPGSVQDYCASPLLNAMTYPCSASSNDTGVLTACATGYQRAIDINDTVCSTNFKAFPATGAGNCVAKTSQAVDDVTVFYQTLYYTSGYLCMAVWTDSGGILLSAKSDRCDSGQLPNSTGSFDTLSLTITESCPITPTADEASDNTALIVGLVMGLLLLAAILAAIIIYFCCCRKDPNAGKPIVENTKPRFEDPDVEDLAMEDLEEPDLRSTPITRDEISFQAVSPSLVSNGKIPNGESVMAANGAPRSFASRRDSGIATLENNSVSENGSNFRPNPRLGLNTSRESMVIFNGDEKVISGNDTRVVPNKNPNPRTFHTQMFVDAEGPMTLEGLDNEEDDVVGELSPSVRENMPYPSLPREKSNLMPPIETSDPENNKESTS